MPTTLSKVLTHGAVLAAGGVGLGAAILLFRDLVKTGSTQEVMRVVTAGVAVLGLGAGVTYYSCYVAGCTCVVGEKALVKKEDERKKSPSFKIQLGGKDSEVSDPLRLYASEHTHSRPVITSLIQESKKTRYPTMASSQETTTFLTILARAVGATKALDIGVFTGLSTLSLALGVAEKGKVIGCELKEDDNIGTARRHWKIAGVEDRIDVHFQPAATTLQELIDAGESGTFDIAFIDADKVNYVTYYELCLKLVRVGGLIILDNTLWSGHVLDPSDNSENTVAIRLVNEHIRNDDRVLSVLLTISDGHTIAQKL